MYRVEYPMVCRLCLLQSDFCINIFSPHGNSGLLVWRIIGEIIDTEVTQEDGLPPTICTVCMGKLVDFQHFRSMCIESRIEWLKHQAIQEMVVPIKTEVDLSDDQLDQTQSFNDEEYTGKDPPDSADSNSQVPNESSTVNCDGWQDLNVQEGNSNNHNIPGSGTLEWRSETPQCMGETQNSGSSQMKVGCCSLPWKNRGKVEEHEAVLIGVVASANDGGMRSEILKDQFNSGARLLELESGKQCQKNKDETYMGQCMLNIYDSNIRVDVPHTSKCDEATVKGWKKERDNDISSGPIVANSGFPHSCYVCSKRFIQKDHLRSHAQSSHLDKLGFSCDFCGKVFRDKSVLFKHTQSHKNVNPLECSQSRKGHLPCTRCSKTFLNRCHLSTHIATVHEMKKPHICNKCSKSFCHRSRLSVHIATVHEGKKLHICNICSKKFSRRCNLSTHIATVHERKKPHICNICSIKFSHRSKLSTHIVTVHEGRKPHSCNICSKTFSNRCHLSTHTATVHEMKKSHICNICSKTFSHKSSLSTHTAMVHDGKTPHQCNICSKEFSHGSHLSTHIAAVHEGKKPHLCNICSKTFSQRSSLSTHIAAVHEGKKPHLCSICSKKFAQRCNLSKHIATVHEGK